MRQPDFGSQTASPPFVGCTVLTQRGVAGAIFWGRSASRRSLQDLLLGQLELHLQPRPLRCGRRSGPKEFARGPPGMAVEDVPFERAVRAGMPPHVEQSRFHRAPVIAVDPSQDTAKAVFSFACQLLANRRFTRSLRAPCHGRRSPRKGRRIKQNQGLLRSCGFRPSIRLPRCIGRGDEIHVPSPLPRVPILGAPLRAGPAHVVQLRPVGVEQGVREGAEQPRSAAVEESVDLCFSHVSVLLRSDPFVGSYKLGFRLSAPNICALKPSPLMRRRVLQQQARGGDSPLRMVEVAGSSALQKSATLLTDTRPPSG
jgi:hypothetical protein